jgi:predicted nucleic acid-binding protein
MSLSFFDTNVLVYSDDNGAPEKREQALRLIANGMQHKNAAISLQILQEYFVTVTRKLGVTPQIAQRKVENFVQSLVLVRVTEREVISAIELHRLDGISFWDALVVSAARLVDARTLYSEDLHPGRKWGGLSVVNPFSS